MSGPSFGFDSSQDLNANGVYDRCVIHFRPHPFWKGEDFGFDWVRVDDTKLGGDMSYATNMGKYYSDEKKQILQENPNSYDGVFVKHPELYEELLKTYFTDQHEISFKKPKKLRDSSIKDAKYWKEVSGYKYYTPVMALTVGSKANLQLIVEMSDKKNPPTRIELRGDTNLFRIDPGDLQPKSGKYKCSIECLAPVAENKEIKAVAIFLDADGNEVEYMCGEVRICKNDLPHLTFNVLCIEVTVMGGPKGEFEGKFAAAEEQNTRKIFKQAMVDCNIKRETLVIDVNEEIGDPYNIHSTTKYKLTDLLDAAMKETFDKTDNLTMICEWAFKKQKLREMRDIIVSQIMQKYGHPTSDVSIPEKRMKFELEHAEEINNEYIKAKNIYNPWDILYKKYSKLFFFKNTGTATIINNQDGSQSNKSTAGFVVIGSPVGAILGNSNTSIAHELLHTLGLLHTFNTKDVKDQLLNAATIKDRQDTPMRSEADRTIMIQGYSQKLSWWDKALFTYTATETGNVLDYGNNKKYLTWYWQWKLIWNKLGERNRS